MEPAYDCQTQLKDIIFKFVHQNVLKANKTRFANGCRKANSTKLVGSVEVKVCTSTFFITGTVVRILQT